jgi:NADPH-dependent curcumin reductase CurA
MGGNAMSDGVNRQILLVEKPAGKLGPEHFKMSKAGIPDAKDGEALLRVRYISLDAANGPGCMAQPIAPRSSQTQ